MSKDATMFRSAFGCDQDFLTAVCEWLARRHIPRAAGLVGATMQGWDLLLKQPQAGVSLSSSGRVSLGGLLQVEGLAVRYDVQGEERRIFWSAAQDSLHPCRDTWQAEGGQGGLLPQELVTMHHEPAMNHRDFERQVSFVAGVAARAIERMGLAKMTRTYPDLLERARKLSWSKITAVDSQDAVTELVNEYKRQMLGA